MTSGSSPSALVTGGTGRIGREVVAALAAEGYEIAVHCHGALAAARELVASLGGRGIAVTTDLREEGAIRAVVHRVADHFGRLDAVVHAARRRVPTPLEETTAADLRLHFDVNVTGAFIVAQEAAAVMARQAAGGSIVLLADPAAEPARPGDVAPLATRSALPGLSRALAAEFAARHPGVRIACVEVAADDPAAGAAAAVARVRRPSSGSRA